MSRGWKILQDELSEGVGMVGGLEVWDNYAPITIDTDISIDITERNCFLEYCLMYIAFII